MKQRIILMAVMASVLLIHTAAFGAGYEYPGEDPGYEEVITKGKVLKIENAAAENDLGDVGIPLTVQEIEVEITSGDYKGRVLNVENHLMDDPGYDIIVEEGDRVELFLEVNNGSIEAAYITSYDRSVYAFYLAAAFIIVLLVVGGIKGLKATVSLAVMVFLIFKVLIPYMLKGYSPIMLSVVVTVISTVVTLMLIGGVTVKSFSAIIGTAGGVLTAAGIAVAVGKVARLTGMGAEEARMLLYIPQGIEFDFQGLLFAGIIIGSLGAVMDVSMSVASSMDEVKHANPKIPTGNLIKSGMNVGRDIMGTMSNTLILAYTGASIPLLLVLFAYDNTLSSVLNLDFITTEVVRSLAGSIGLIMTIPLTAFVTGYLEKYNTAKTSSREDVST
jgi:uncharacterized membrane protein